MADGVKEVEVVMEPDPSLEDLDDIDGPIDDAWAEAVRLMAKDALDASAEVVK